MKKLLLSTIAIVMSFFMIAAPVSAAGECPEGCVPTSILGENGCSCDKNGDGSAIIGVLRLVVNIMTAGIGVLATIGIVVSGTQYLTAGGNEDQIKKSKRRIFEIIIGLVAYAVVYALLYWLLPGFNGV